MSQELQYPIISALSDDKKPCLFANYLTKQSEWRHPTSKVGWEPYQDAYLPDRKVFEDLATEATPETQEAFVEEVMRNNHFALLNCLPPIAGTKWAVTEKIYWYFKEILPPLDYYKKSKGFRISEGKTGNVWSVYYYENGHYWHEWVEL